VADGKHLVTVELGPLDLVAELQFEIAGGGIGLDEWCIEARVKKDALKRGEAENCC
jgi:hypothetical protein